jgi:hypothetical protein
LTVLLLFAQRKTNYWWLVTWFDLIGFAEAPPVFQAGWANCSLNSLSSREL